MDQVNHELKQLIFNQGVWLMPSCLFLTILALLLAVPAQVVGISQILKGLMIFKFRLRISFEELGPAFSCPLEKPMTPLEASRLLQEVLWVGHTLGRVLSMILFGKN